MDPRTRLGLLAAVGVLAITLDRPGSLLLLVAICVLPMIAVRPSRAWWLRGLGVVVALVWSTVFSQAIFYAQLPRVPLGSLGPLVFYREGVSYGLVQSLRLVAVGLAGLALAVTTPSDRLHAALLRLRLPFGVALMTATALRFVPEVTREWQVVRRARAGRGRPAWRRTPWAWLALEVSMLRPVVARSVRRAWALAASLDARGFDPVAPRTARRPLVLSWWEVALLLGVAVGVAGVVAARLLYVLYTSETFYASALRPLYGFVRGWL